MNIYKGRCREVYDICFVRYALSNRFVTMKVRTKQEGENIEMGKDPEELNSKLNKYDKIRSVLREYASRDAPISKKNNHRSL